MGVGRGYCGAGPCGEGRPLRCHDLAALSWSDGKLKDSAEYQKAPMYFDACQQWHERLSEDDKETCLTLADGQTGERIG